MEDYVSELLAGAFFGLPIFTLIILAIFIISKFIKKNLGLINALFFSIIIYLIPGILLVTYLYLSAPKPGYIYIGASGPAFNNLFEVVLTALIWPAALFCCRS